VNKCEVCGKTFPDKQHHAICWNCFQKIKKREIKARCEDIPENFLVGEQ